MFKRSRLQQKVDRKRWVELKATKDISNKVSLNKLLFAIVAAVVVIVE